MDELRIGDAERESALVVLGEQYSLGRLTKDEFDERSDAVWSARTRGDLAPVFADLPVRSPALPAKVQRHRPGRGFPLLPVLFVLVAITVITKLPFVLLALLLWFGFSRWHWGGRWRRHWSGDLQRHR